MAVAVNLDPTAHWLVIQTYNIDGGGFCSLLQILSFVNYLTDKLYFFMYVYGNINIKYN